MIKEQISKLSELNPGGEKIISVKRSMLDSIHADDFIHVCTPSGIDIFGQYDDTGCHFYYGLKWDLESRKVFQELGFVHLNEDSMLNDAMLFFDNTLHHDKSELCFELPSVLKKFLIDNEAKYPKSAKRISFMPAPPPKKNFWMEKIVNALETTKKDVLNYKNVDDDFVDNVILLYMRRHTPGFYRFYEERENY